MEKYVTNGQWLTVVSAHICRLLANEKLHMFSAECDLDSEAHTHNIQPNRSNCVLHLLLFCFVFFLLFAKVFQFCVRTRHELTVNRTVIGGKCHSFGSTSEFGAREREDDCSDENKEEGKINNIFHDIRIVCALRTIDCRWRWFQSLYRFRNWRGGFLLLLLVSMKSQLKLK